MPKLFVAMKAFLNYNGKILILRESPNYVEGTNVSKFDVAGGRVEAGQKFDESLLREIKEECGLEAKIGRPFFVNEAWPIVKGEQWQVIRVFFECFAESDKVVLSKDHDSYEWIEPKDFASYDIIPNLRPVFEAYLKMK